MASIVGRDADAADDIGRPAAAYPRRFRAAEARGVRIGRPLRLLGRTEREIDEALLDRIGRAFLEEDDAGAALAAAMRLPAGTPGRVTHRQLREALASPAREATRTRERGRPAEREFGRMHSEFGAEGEFGQLHDAEDEFGRMHGAEHEFGRMGRDRSINRPISYQPTELSAQPQQPTELSAEPQHVTERPRAPDALRRFLDEVTTVPAWVDWDLVEAGAAVQRRLGQNEADVLLQLSLVGGYRFGGPTDVLAATGALTGSTLRRLAETQEWTIALSEPGALRPYGTAWRATAHVRAMHALVNASLLGRREPDGTEADDTDPRSTKRGSTKPDGADPASTEPVGTGPDRTPPDGWDIAHWGLPINQADQAATLGLFDGTLILGCRALGVPIPPSDSRALMHLWKWVGHLLGVHPDFLVDDEWARHRLNYHVLLAQDGISEAGPRLAQALVAAQADRTYRGPSWWQPWRARFERERLLSMLTAFLGVRSMRELGLPLRPPWAHAYLLPLNVWRYHVLGRGRRGRERLDRWGRRRSDAILATYRSDPR
ncbi:oxygenase MpaB family protein [Promicromonospora aerolata]|uniref:Oxygenase MpaB family protein n=1 Tax=Promicromonospora aerolata TaxID=195749 RepID=A0ABW4V9G7_9MICO